MTTKRMKKLLMGMGLSRNQATRMIQEQRTEGSKDVSNALYFHVFQKDFNLCCPGFFHHGFNIKSIPFLTLKIGFRILY